MPRIKVRGNKKTSAAAEATAQKEAEKIVEQAVQKSLSSKMKNEAHSRAIWDLRVFIVGGGFQYAKMMSDAGFKGCRNVQEADMVLFTGGEDVDPQLYGETALPGTYFNVRRDEVEQRIFRQAVEYKKPMIGICRGGQFLNVMNGGKLWQDVNNHTQGHDITCMKTGDVIGGMTSTHHQMMRPGPNCEVLALACQATLKQSQSETVDRTEPELDDVEVVWYPDTLSLCFQPHPEFYYGSCRDYFLNLVDEYILPAC